jgi:anhydro-N-acetylmuramic acid kinase
MNHQYYNVIGVMSGTSLDGVDIARIELVRDHRWTFQIKECTTVPYPDYWIERLEASIELDRGEIKQLDIDYTTFLGDQINSFIQMHEINNLLTVCSHGHTILHQPEKGITLQIGNLPQLAQQISCRVVCDYRTADVLLGGQGAPLVPIGDQLLFSEYDYCLNLGGFANLSTRYQNSRIAYDICAVNVVMNYYARKLGKEYDDNGAFAKAGTPQTPQLEALNQLTFYTLQGPKSLGMEWVNAQVFPILESIEKVEDILATYVEHVAQQITTQVKDGNRVLVTGGGAYNKYLMQRLSSDRSVTFIVPEAKLIEYKEALIFALLGVLRLRNTNNCLSSVTGARYDHCSGVIHVP